MNITSLLIILLIWNIIFFIVRLAGTYGSIPLLLLAIYLAYLVCIKWFPVFLNNKEGDDDTKV